jgi:hypothetical protein
MASPTGVDSARNATRRSCAEKNCGLSFFCGRPPFADPKVWSYRDGHGEAQKVQLAQASSNWRVGAEMMETRVIDGEVWTKVPKGFGVLPLEATSSMYKRGGNVPISNVSKDGKRRRGRIGDLAARDAWAAMVAAFQQYPEACIEQMPADPSAFVRAIRGF